MVPKYKHNDLILVKKIQKNRKIAIKRNDIIVFLDPITQKKPFIKRVIGLPGELIQIYDTGVITADNIVVNNSPATHLENKDTIVYEWKLHDEFIVLGDNREESFDSRKFGPINANLLLGKVKCKIWSG